MFDISFWELILICVVALVVLGPDKLPGAIRTIGLWVGRIRRSFNNIKADIEREVGADDIRRQLRNEAILEKIKKTKTQLNDTVNSVKKQAEAVKEDLNIERQVTQFKNEAEGALKGPQDTSDSTSGSGDSDSETASKNKEADSAPDTSAHTAPDAASTGSDTGSKPTKSQEKNKEQ